MGMWWLRPGLYDLRAKNTLFSQAHGQEILDQAEGEREKKKWCYEKGEGGGGGGGHVRDKKSEFWDLLRNSVGQQEILLWRV